MSMIKVLHFLKKNSGSGMRLFMASLLAILCVLPDFARAGSERSFDIEQQSLATALNEFASQSDRQILFSTEAVESKQTHGIKGLLEPEAALRQLLKGTGLTFRVRTDSTILVDVPRTGATARVADTEAAVLRVAQNDQSGGSEPVRSDARTGLE